LLTLKNYQLLHNFLLSVDSKHLAPFLSITSHLADVTVCLWPSTSFRLSQTITIIAHIWHPTHR